MTAVIDFNDLSEHIRSGLSKGMSSFLFYEDDENEKCIFKKLLIQSLYKNIYDIDVPFLAIKNIVLKKEYRGSGLLSRFLEDLDDFGIPVMFHSVINNDLGIFLEKNGYTFLSEEFGDDFIVSYYKNAEKFTNKCGSFIM